MKAIDIRITKARIKSFSVELRDDLPAVTSTIALFTENDKKVSEFTVSTSSYYDLNFDFPAVMIPPIKDIAEKLEEIVTAKCRASQNLLAAPEESS